MNERNEFSKQFKRYPVSFISKWRSTWENRNVYRTMKLWRQSVGGEAILGPFVLDIDNGNEDLDDTLAVTRQAFAYMVGTLKLTPEQDVRIFFSGRKGFNIEAVPASLGITGNIDQQIRASADCRDTIIRGLKERNSLGLADGNTVSARETVIDRAYSKAFGSRSRNEIVLAHPYIRLHGSFNCWRADAVQKCRRRIRLTVAEFTSLSTSDILELADLGS